MKMNYYIGEYYRYPNQKTRFKLIRATEWVYYFECGHWCTDSVFMDLIRCKTNIQVSQDLQIELF